MITDEQIEAALSYLALDPHPKAAAHFELSKARIACRRRRAELLVRWAGEGTVAERDARVELDNEYGDLLYVEAGAEFTLENEKARVTSAEAIIEMWRTLQANARQAERVR